MRPVPTCLTSALLSASALLLAAGCGKAEEPASAAEAETAPPAIVLHNVSFVDSRGSRVFAAGHLDRLTYDRQSGSAVAQGAQVRFPRAEAPGNAVDLSAPIAQGNPLEGWVSGQGGVQFNNQQGQSGSTDRATYWARQGEASGDTPVVLRGPGFVLVAPGFRWTASDDQLRLGPATLVTEAAGNGLLR